MKQNITHTSAVSPNETTHNTH